MKLTYHVLSIFILCSIVVVNVYSQEVSSENDLVATSDSNNVLEEIDKSYPMQVQKAIISTNEAEIIGIKSFDKNQMSMASSDSYELHSQNDYDIQDNYIRRLRFPIKNFAPSGAKVTNIEYKIRIKPKVNENSFYCRDYEVWLSSSSTTTVPSDINVYNNLGAQFDGGYDDDAENDSDIFLNWRSTDFFNGEYANQYWGLVIEDKYSGGEGTLDYLHIKVHWSIGGTTGTIELQVKNQDGSSTPYPGRNGEGILKQGSNAIDTDNTNSSGVLKFNNVPYGSGYYAEVYHSPAQSISSTEPEYWGKTSNHTVNGDETWSDFVRYMPFVKELELYQNGNKLDWGATVNAGTSITVRVTVRNNGGASGVKSRVVIDRSRGGSMDYDITSSSKSIAYGSERTFDFTWTPTSMGKYYIVPAGTYAYDGGRYKLTDSWYWSDHVYFNVSESPTTGTIELQVKNQDGSSTPYPGANANVLLKQGNTVISVEETNANGKAIFNNVPYGSGYYAEVKHWPRGAILGSTILEYWGKTSNFNVDGAETLLDFTRNMPYTIDLEIYKDGRLLNWGETIEAGTEISIRTTVQTNGTTYDVKSEVIADRDKRNGWDFNETSGFQRVGSSSSKTFNFNWRPYTEGTYHLIAAATYSFHDGAFILTDTWDWVEDFYLVVTSSGGEPEIEAPTSITINQNTGAQQSYSFVANYNYSDIIMQSTDLSKPHVQNELIVKFKYNSQINPNFEKTLVSNNSEVDNLLFQNNVQLINSVYKRSNLPPSLKNTYRIKFGYQVNLEEMIEQLIQNPDVEWASPNYIYELNDVPNDPDYSEQWYLEKINADKAWDIGVGSADIIIAIIDTGVDWDHPDLEDNIWNNEDEIEGNGIDDDGNGFVDDVRGWDFFDGFGSGSDTHQNEDGEDPDNNPMDFNGHGTHCAGIASASTNNSVGIAGLGRGCTIMPLRAGGSTNEGKGVVNFSAVSSSIDYAITNGASIINMSFEGGSFLLPAIRNAFNNGLLVLHAAGNDTSSTKSLIDGIPETISVAATDNEDNIASFSNYGNWIDVSAPGVNIQSTYFNNRYQSLQGTSMATPLVAGLAGLILSQNPTLTPAEVTNIIVNSADNIDDENPGFEGQLGSGRINAFAALQSLGENIIIENIGDAPLIITSVENSQPAWLSLLGIPQGEIIIQPESSETIMCIVDWDELSSIQETAIITINSNDRDEPSLEINVTAIPADDPNDYYYVTTYSNPQNGGTTTGGGSYEENDIVTVRALSNSDWEFLNWTENGTEVSDDEDYSFSINRDRDFTANFEIQTTQYTITTIANPNEGGVTTGDGTYESGELLEVTATPSPNWRFKNWTEGGYIVADYSNYQFEVASDRDLMANFEPVAGDDNHFVTVWSGTPYQAMNILLEGVTLDGSELSNGDEIGVFDGDKCVGVIKLSGAVTPYVEIKASKDNPQTGVIDGFIQGNEIIFKLWDKSNNEELIATNAIFRQGYSLVFTDQGSAFVILEFSTASEITQTLNFSPNTWHLSSLYVDPVDKSTEGLFTPLTSTNKLVKVQDESGNAIIKFPNGIWSYGIPNLILTEGYYIYINQICSLDITGTPISLPFNIPLAANAWNIVSYPKSIPMDAKIAFNDLMNSNVLVKVQDYQGNSLIRFPNGTWYNGIGNLQPGQGYYIYVTENSTLVYTSNTNLAKVHKEELESLGSEYYTNSLPSPFMPMNVYLIAIPEEIKEMGAFNSETNELVSTAKIVYDSENNYRIASFIISSKNQIQDETFGLDDGKQFYIEAWDGIRSYKLSFANINQLSFQKLSTIFLDYGKDLKNIEFDSNDIMLSNYPNPFNPTTKIHFALSNNEQLSLVIYNVLGEEITRLIDNEFIIPGVYEYAWDASNLSSGIYFYQLIKSGEVITNKMILMK